MRDPYVWSTDSWDPTIFCPRWPCLTRASPKKWFPPDELIDAASSSQAITSVHYWNSLFPVTTMAWQVLPSTLWHLSADFFNVANLHLVLSIFKGISLLIIQPMYREKLKIDWIKFEVQKLRCWSHATINMLENLQYQRWDALTHVSGEAFEQNFLFPTWWCPVFSFGLAAADHGLSSMTQTLHASSVFDSTLALGLTIWMFYHTRKCSVKAQESFQPTSESCSILGFTRQDWYCHMTASEFQWIYGEQFKLVINCLRF